MNKILNHIKQIEAKYMITFKPTREFYETIGIGQRRWQMLLKNKTAITSVEMENLKKYFGLESMMDLLVEE